MDLIGRNADFDACAREKAIFEADEKIYNAFTAREAAHPSTNCIYGNGIIWCNRGRSERGSRRHSGKLWPEPAQAEPPPPRRH
jgi:hypothetical protein